MAGARHPGIFLGAAAVVVALDQLTKHWALSALADGPIDLVGSLRLNLVFNDRAAFSLGGGGNTTVIASIGLVLVAALLTMGLRARAPGVGARVGHRAGRCARQPGRPRLPRW